MRQVEQAFRVVESDTSRVVLLGLDPHGPDPEYGYMIPGASIEANHATSVRQVEMFVEKPCKEAAEKIIARGALWNTMVMVFACETLLSVIQRAVPELYHSLTPISTRSGHLMKKSRLKGFIRNYPPSICPKACLKCFLLSIDEPW